jgi:uncharacterized protein YjbI with pentapeptide repeats
MFSPIQSHTANLQPQQTNPREVAREAFKQLRSPDSNAQKNALCTLASLDDPILKESCVYKFNNEFSPEEKSALPMADFMRDMTVRSQGGKMTDFVNKLNLSGVKMENSDFSNLDLRNLKLSGVEMKGANFNNASLRNCSFNKCQMNDAHLSFSLIEDTSMVRCSMRNADLSVSRQLNVDYADCNLNGATFQFSHLDNVELDTTNRSNLIASNFSGAAMSDENYDKLTDINAATGYKIVILDDNNRSEASTPGDWQGKYENHSTSHVKFNNQSKQVLFNEGESPDTLQGDAGNDVFTKRHSMAQKL